MSVGDLEDVVEVVADQDHAEAVVGEPADEVEDLLGLGDAEGGGRLVEDDDLGVPQHGAWRSPRSAAGHRRGYATCCRTDFTVRTERAARVSRGPLLHA